MTDGCGRTVTLTLTLTLTLSNWADISVAPALLDKLSAPTRLLADRGYDANSLRARLTASKTEAVIPSTRFRKVPIPHDETAYSGRNMLERVFCRLKDWRRIATRYDKLAINFASAVAIAAVILWWTLLSLDPGPAIYKT